MNQTTPANRTEGVSIVVPLFNEVGNLRPLHDELRQTLDRLGVTWEVIWVDDASTDGSLELLRELAAAAPGQQRVFSMARNGGQSAALDAGFRAARFTQLVTLDADGQNDPADIPRLLTGLVHADLVCGVRARRRDSWLRRLSSRIANWVRRRILRDSVADTGCSLKAFRTEALDRVRMFRGAHRFLPMLLELDGFQATQLPVNHRERQAGVSKYGVRNRAVAGLLDALAVRWMQSRQLSYQCRELL